MPSSFLQTLLSTPYPSVFGNALTMAEAQDLTNSRNARNLDSYIQQNDANMQTLMDAAVSLGNAQADQRSAKKNYEKIAGIIDKFAPAPARNNMNLPGKTAETNLKNAQAAYDNALKTYNRGLSQYSSAQAAEANHPASMAQAVNWGQLAQQAENRMINQAAGAAANAIANENARMATLAAHPLLGGGIR